jgi:hypothetical protein
MSPKFRFWMAHFQMRRIFCQAGARPSKSSLMRLKISAVREHCPPEKPLAIRYSPFTTYHSLFAIRRRFGSAGASPTHNFAD